MTANKNGRRKLLRSAFSVFVLFCFLFILLLAMGMIATFTNVKGLSLETIPQLFEFSPDNALAYKVWDVRLPRVILAVIIGAALATAGCLLQAITHNALADPEVMGVNQGASLFAVSGLMLFGQEDVSAVIMIAACIGAVAGGSVVYSMSFRRLFTPTRLVLSGIAVSFFFGSMTTGLILIYDTSLSEIIYWMAGKLSGASWLDVKLGLMFILPVVAVSFFMGGQFNLLALGDEIAQGLGQKVTLVRRAAAIMTAVLVGGAVAVAGPIGFVGLMVPHMARFLIGPDYRLIIPLSALLGATLLLAADFAGQYVMYPAETPVGIITALLGVPFFLYLLNRPQTRPKASAYGDAREVSG